MSFVLTTEQRSQCETVALSFPSYFVKTQITIRHINRITATGGYRAIDGEK